jgi:hypothetical protein
MEGFDVVIVPDFSGRSSVTFEARTLYFLASWLEFSDASGKFPLHIACIGEPPRSVRTLAERCGAAITVHEPAPPELGVYANKLRGFEVSLQTRRIALLDVDILLLSDLSVLADAVPVDTISANPSHAPILLPEMFDDLYARLGVPPPTERMADFHLTLDMSESEVAELTRNSDLVPTYNTGVIVAPRDSDLARVWTEHLKVLGEYRDRWNQQLRPYHMAVTDEPAFATALHALRLGGAPFVRLPDKFNCRWRHLYRRTPSMRELVIFHMTSSFAYGKNLEEKLSPAAWGYQKKLIKRYGKRWLRHSGSHARGAVRHLLPASVEVLRLRPIFQTLYDKHIRSVVS